jgi:beta-glucosidase
VGEIDVDAVLAQLTLEEKASLVLGSDFWHTAGVPRLGVEPVMVTDGPHGLRKQPTQADHVGIGGSVPATCFPTAAALGSTWDPTLLAEVGRAIAEEALAQQVSVVLGPGVNIKRSPLCGRNFEYFSEDPYLSGELALAMVAAMQSEGVGTSLKHFAANNQEDDRLRVSAEVDERTLREIYLPAFERVVTRAQPWTVMCAYNKVNGTYASEHTWLLTTVLREEWGFEGLVVSDWGAVHDRVAALAAGLDLEMPPNLGRSDRAVVEAVRSGVLPEQVLDASVRRVLTLLVRAGAARADTATEFSVEQHHALARRAAAASAVLLKNDGDVLPLAPSPGSRVAVIGAFAESPRFQGAGSSQVNPTQVDIPLDQLRLALGADVEVVYAPGFDLDSDAPDTALVQAAARAAASADVVVLFVGLPATAESEGFDRTHLDLPPNQLAVIEAVAAANPRVAVVLANGSVVRLQPWQHRVGAVLECWLGGQAAGGAVADLLVGRQNPGGKLAETIPHRLQDVPSYLNFPGDSQVVRYGEGLFVGYRGFDALDLPVDREFGFGLSYTTFQVDPPVVTVSGSVASGDLAVHLSVPVTNTGTRAGAEVVQVYVSDSDSKVVRPPRELRAFARVVVEAGETVEAQLSLDERAFAYWSVLLGRWAVEAGDFVLHVGTSSRRLPHLYRLHLDAPSVQPPLSRDATLHEWLADPAGRRLLEAWMQQAGGGSVLGQHEMIKVIGTMPMSTLAGFGIAGFDHDALDELVARL